MIYVNANDIPWSTSIARDHGNGDPRSSDVRESVCGRVTATTMQGGSGFPPLRDIAARRNAAQVADIVLSGQGRMPAFSALPTQTVNAVVRCT